MATGIICLWFGDIGDIPAGWLLCDGTAGTPELRNRFVVGAGDSYAPDDNGGATSHQHVFVSGLHRHFLSAAGAAIAGGAIHDRTANQKVVFGSTNFAVGDPPRKALAFIMRE